MARRVGLPSPSVAPFGAPGRSFSQYDVLDNGSRDDGREFQKAQAMWAAGKITNDQYLAAYQKYVNGLDKGSSERINAQQSLDKERYTFARNDIVARIDSGDESAWDDLLAYDQASLAGMQTNNEEYQRRLSYMRSTQASIFQNRYAEIQAKVDAGKMTYSQAYAWLRAQQNGGLTANNAALKSQIVQYADAMQTTIANERREQVYSRYQDGKMAPGAFIDYARRQRNMFAKGTVDYFRWQGRMRAAVLARQDSRMAYRWGLSEQYHANVMALQSPDPLEDKKGGTRKVYGANGWREESIDYVPTQKEVAAHQEWQQDQARLKAENKAIERRLGQAGVEFVTPRQMVKFYRERQKTVVKGSQEWLSLQDSINQFRDAQTAWDTFKPENGFFPTRATGKKTAKTKGRALPTESQMNAKTFMRALGSQYGGKKAEDAGLNRYGMTANEWRLYAGEYLGDQSARQTPDNLEIVTEARLNDLYERYGSWAMVGYAWVNGGDAATISQWDPASKQTVDAIWQTAGLGSLPSEWTFTTPRGVDPSVAGPITPGQEYLGAGEVSEPQLFAITGPTNTAGIPQTQKTAGIRGMTPGAFDNLYANARSAFLNDDTSFEYNGTNYYFPADLGTRADMMGDLDKARIDLLEGDWHEAEFVVAAMNGQATKEQLDAADDKRQKHAKAYDESGQNAIDMLFMQQKAGYNPTTGEDTTGGPNYNPGADFQRISELSREGVEKHLAAAADWFNKGHTTQAVVELQEAADIAERARAHIAALDEQVQLATKMVQSKNMDLTSTQQSKIEKVAAWEAEWGEEGDITGEIQKQRDEVYQWLALDEQGNIKWSADGENVMERPGTVKILQHSQDGSEDTVRREILKTRPRPGQTFGQLAPEPYLENTIMGAAMIGGDTVELALPYEQQEIGNIITPAGEIVPVMGKIIYTNIGGLNQTVIENPFSPGQYQVMDGDTDQPQGFVFRAPDNIKIDKDANGNQSVSWDAGGYTYSLAWNGGNGAYDLLRQNNDKGLLGLDEKPVEYVGNLGDNPQLAIDTVAPLFQRDMSTVPKYAKDAQTMPGAMVGMTAEQYGKTRQVERQATLREQERWVRQGGQNIPARMPTPTEPISDDMRGTIIDITSSQQRAPQPGPAPSPSPAQMSQPQTSAVQIEVGGWQARQQNFDFGIGQRPEPVEPALPTPSRPRPTGTPKPTETKQPTYTGRKPIAL